MRYRMALVHTATFDPRFGWFAEGETLEELVAQAMTKAIRFDEPEDTWTTDPSKFTIFEKHTETVYRRAT